MFERCETMKDNQLREQMVTELRRGTQIILVLNALDDPQYGYSLLQKLEKIGINIEAGTLYPLLRRLDAQGLLESIWDTNESRPRKYYQLNDQGKMILDELKHAWLDIVKDMEVLFKEKIK